MQQAALLNRQLPPALLGAFANIVVLTFGFWSVAPRTALLVWAVANTLVLAARAGQWAWYRSRQATYVLVRRWVLLYRWLTLVSGSVWGAVAIAFFPASAPHQLLYTFVAGGISAGAVATYTPMRGLAATFFLPFLLPLAVRYFAAGGQIGILMGILVLVYAGMLVLVTRTLHETTVATLRLRLENAGLLEFLSAAKEQAERLNEELGREISERVRAEGARLALAESEARLRAIAEATPTPLFIADREAGTLLHANGPLRDLLALEAGDAPGRDIFALVEPPGVAADLRDTVRRAGTIANREIGLRKADGGTAWALLAAQALDYGGQPAVLGGLTDITPQKRAEEELRDSQRLLRTVLDALPLALSLKDRGGRYRLLNRAWSEQYGVPGDRFLGREARDLAGWPADALAAVLEADRDVLDSGHPANLDDLVVQPVRGAARTLRLMKSPYRDEAGAVVGVVTLGEDITERRHLEERLRRAQRMEAIGELAGGVAHDFNNSMQVIRGFTEMTLLQGRIDEAAREHLTEALRAAERGSHLARQLLAFSRRQVMSPRPLNMNDLIGEQVKMLQRVLGPDIRFSVEPSSDIAAIQGDPGMLEQVLLNLCLNARDAMPHGGQLTVSTADVRLGVEDCFRHEGLTPGRYVRISVADTGTGMPEDVQSRIFEPFFTTKEPDRGTGLGLSTVYGIVRQHQGAIALESEEGRGSTFTLYLPAAAEAGADAPARPHGLPDGGSESVLVAEDDPSVLKLVTMLLEGKGYTVHAARDGREALELYERYAAELKLLVLDVIMPGMSGREVFDIVRTRDPELPVLFCTGFSRDDLDESLLDNERRQLLRKPYTVSELLGAVRDLLDRRAVSAGNGGEEAG